MTAILATRVRPYDRQFFLFDADAQSESIEPVTIKETHDWVHCRPGALGIHLAKNHPARVELSHVHAPAIPDIDSWEFIAEYPLTVRSGRVVVGAQIDSEAVAVPGVHVPPGEYSVGVLRRGIGTKNEAFHLMLWRERCPAERILRPYSGSVAPPHPLSLNGRKPADVFDVVNAVVGLTLVLSVLLGIVLGPLVGMLLGLLIPALGINSQQPWAWPLIMSIQYAVGLGVPLALAAFIVVSSARAGILPSSRSYSMLGFANMIFLAALAVIVYVYFQPGGGSRFAGVGIVVVILLIPGVLLGIAGAVQLLAALRRQT